MRKLSNKIRDLELTADPLTINIYNDIHNKLKVVQPEQRLETLKELSVANNTVDKEYYDSIVTDVVNLLVDK